MRETDYDKVDTLYVTGQEIVQQVVRYLVDKSCWFEFEPVPDGRYRIYLKPEGHAERAMAHYQTHSPTVFGNLEAKLYRSG